MNKELMLRVADQIEREPEKFDMGSWGWKRQCGTVACIAGTALILHYGDRIRATASGSLMLDDHYIDEPEEAMKVLGLTFDQRMTLFYYGEWPAKYAELAQKSEGQAAVKLIREMVEKEP